MERGMDGGREGKESENLTYSRDREIGEEGRQGGRYRGREELKD